MEVILVWYHTGFHDDPPELVDVCEDMFASNQSMLEKNKARKLKNEYNAPTGNTKHLWTERRTVRES